MNIGERILIYLSKEPQADDYIQQEGELTLEAALRTLHRVYPDLGELIRGRRIADFGCGVGMQSIAMASQFDCEVVGIDSNQKTLARAVENAKRNPLTVEKLSFVDEVRPEMHRSFDVVISQNSFEHFPNPNAVLEQMSSLLRDGGVILVTFGPPWFAPYGSHMHFFCKVPWINLLFSEQTVMRVRSRFRDDGAMRYEEVESGLNKMSIAKFESIVSACNLALERKSYECVKGMNWLGRIPLARELFINHVTAVLRKA